MKHSNISIFIPHLGCPNKCSFCDQSVIASTTEQRSLDEIRTEIINAAINFAGVKQTAEIAFFGGSFTAIEHDYMVSLLKIGKGICDEYGFSGIRISTRPDAITQPILDILKKYSVKAIELGAQSMDDEVLYKNSRGHSKEDVVVASKLIKENGFELGLQMMVGLYAQDEESVYKTAGEIIAIKPNTVRIYPTVILKNTYLAKLYNSGEYRVCDLKTAVKICADLILDFEKNDIKIIKIGLHSSTDVLNSMVGGIYHPAFRELCESEIYYKLACEKLNTYSKNEPLLLYVNSREISKMLGQKRANLNRLLQDGYNVKILADDGLEKRKIRLERGALH